MSLQQLRVADDLLRQIRQSICNLEMWNEHLTDADDFLTSPEGMKTLAADCMLIEAIGEGIKRVDELTQHLLLPQRPEIPWKAVKGMRNHIAHGYFDINNELIWDVIKNDLPDLHNAIDFFIEHLYETIPFDEGEK